jgi:hypothetical protein
MKHFSEDYASLTERATRAAWLETSTLRMQELRLVFEDCGPAAEVYANPRLVRQLFVSAVSKAFMENRKATVYRQAV